MDPSHVPDVATAASTVQKDTADAEKALEIPRASESEAGSVQWVSSNMFIVRAKWPRRYACPIFEGSGQ